MMMFVGLLACFMGFCAVSEEMMLIGLAVFLGGIVTHAYWGF